jgi:predicted transcriptional regulator
MGCCYEDLHIDPRRLEVMIDWNELALKLKYADTTSMWTDLYETKKKSISTLATELGVSRNTIRDALAKASIVIRERGGPNNKRLEVTDALLEECEREGVAKVAANLGLSYSTLYKRIYKAKRAKAASARTAQFTVTGVEENHNQNDNISQSGDELDSEETPDEPEGTT